MVPAQHPKHAKIARPALGHFGRNEFAFVGTNCGNIQRLARQVIERLGDRYHCAYLDADHAPAGENPQPAGTAFDYTKTVHGHRLQVNAKLGSHQFRQVFNGCDLLLVNGNHHEAAAQIVVTDLKKEDSLRKRLHQLTNVRLVLLAGGAEKPFDFLENALPDMANVPCLPLHDLPGIIRFFENEMLEKTPPVNGLVLAGGRSTRMGRDKGTIEWHGKPQREHMAETLQTRCGEVFVSCRPGQEDEIGAAFPALPDTFSELGPFGAILSAFRFRPDCTWLIVACDLPLLDHATLDFLLENRQTRRVATAFESPFDQMPEPLIAVWEPKSYAVLLAFLAQGHSCPRKVLLNSDVLILKPPDPKALTNVNTPDEAEKIGYLLI